MWNVFRIASRRSRPQRTRHRTARNHPRRPSSDGGSCGAQWQEDSYIRRLFRALIASMLDLPWAMRAWEIKELALRRRPATSASPERIVGLGLDRICSHIRIRVARWSSVMSAGCEDRNVQRLSQYDAAASKRRQSDRAVPRHFSNRFAANNRFLQTMSTSAKLEGLIYSSIGGRVWSRRPVP